MIYTDTQIIDIIKTNPQKDLVKDAKDQCDRLTMLIHGHNIKNGVIQDKFFENDDLFASRMKSAVSNKDLFGRLFQREQMVFTAQGGSANYEGINKNQALELNATLDEIRFGVTLRDWIQQFALPAFRCDPMGIIFIESDKNGNAYPTYQSIACIFDYLPNGRKLEYVCFKLTKADLDLFGVEDETLKNAKPDFITNYYRFVDDARDEIYKFTSSVIENVQIDVVNSVNTLDHPWDQTPGFILSDIISFENTKKFLSPVSIIDQLANSYLNDRSIRDLQKKYHGFAKAFEPLLTCGICMGTGFLSGAACPECTPAGADRGTGFKLRTKVADIARFPLSSLKDAGFDVNKVFGYVKLPIDVWNKQDSSLADIEDLIRAVYWGEESKSKITGPNGSDKSIEETATKSMINLQPVYARLNKTADWAEKTENIIAGFIGQFKFPSFKKSHIIYGRYYILETPYELMEEYLEMKSKGANQSALFAALRRYLHSMYQSDPSQLAIEIKMMNVEPFVHNTVAQVQANNPAKIDYYTKLYFSEWKQLQPFEVLFASDENALRQSLITFATAKQKLISEEPVAPAVAVAERITST